MGKFIDLTGQRFGRLTVIGWSYNDKNNASHWLCKCDCGNHKIIRGDGLRNRVTRSCGCYHKEKMKESATKHGYAGTKIYSIWVSMKKRCCNPKDPVYENYGGRGISLCNEWKDTAKIFIEWALANGYEEKLCLDRINNDGNYFPNNCRFVDRGLSNRNTRLLRKNNTSGYRGVSFDKQTNKYRASIRAKGKTIRLGRFVSPVQAAFAYDQKAEELNDGRPLNFG